MSPSRLMPMKSRQKFLTLFILCLTLLCQMSFFPLAVSSSLESSLMPPDDEKTLRLLLVPEQNTFEQRRRYKYITDYLSRKMEMNVIVEIMANYGEISVAFQEGSADAGFFGSFSYVLTHVKSGIEPIARPEWLDGNSTYRGYIFVRKDSGIRTVEDMKGKSLVLVDKATTAGYIFQRYYLKYYGINKMEDYFSRISYARSHDAAAWAVYSGEAEIGGAKNHIFESLGGIYPDFKKQMLVIAESPEFPSNGLAVRKDLNPALKLRLKTLLLGLNESEEGRQVLKNFKARRFVETTNDDYRVIYNMVNDLGIDLEGYTLK